MGKTKKNELSCWERQSEGDLVYRSAINGGKGHCQKTPKGRKKEKEKGMDQMNGQ